jgi:RimJ/RimL family protein N-acetyltransferase
VSVELHTPRLLLRPWQDSDRAPFAALNADPEVMRYFPALQTREASDRSIDTWNAEHAERGWSNWAVALKASGEFIGFIGLSVPKRALPFMPCVEIGYRLARRHWGHGYATEGGREALRFGFETLRLDEIVSFTAKLNRPSQAVMQRLGLSDAGEDFDHPALPPGHALQRHCLYRLPRSRWQAAASAPAGQR